MCGIAGIISRNGERQIGSEMTRMLQSMKHRGPDSTGYALYGAPTADWVMRVKLADANTHRDYDFGGRMKANRAEIERRLRHLGATIRTVEESREYALEALAADELVKSAMPGRLYEVFNWYKRDEWERYLAAVTDWEREEYLECLP